LSNNNLIAQSPIINSINPNYAYLGQALEVKISGQSTHFTQASNTANSVWFSQGTKTISPYQTFILNDTSINSWFNIPNNTDTGYWNVNTINNVDGIVGLTNGMRIGLTPLPPKIVFVNPDTVYIGKTISVSITTQNTHFGQGTSTTEAWFSASGFSFPIVGIKIISPTELTGYINSNVFPVYLNFTTNINNSIDGHFSKPNSFSALNYLNYYDEKRLLSISRNWGELNKLYTFTLKGHKTHFTGGYIVLEFKNRLNSMLTTTATNINVINDSLLTFDAKIEIGNDTDTWDLFYTSLYDNLLLITDAFVVSPVSIRNVDNSYNINIFPNPSNDIINIQSSVIKNTKVEISIVNLSGALLYSNNYSISNSLDKRIDISKLPAGIYFILVKFDGNSIYKKLLKN